MIAKIGSELDPTRSRMAQFAMTPKGRELRASIGIDPSPAQAGKGGLRAADPREAEMRRLALKAGVGAGNFPMQGNCDTSINAAAFNDILQSLAQNGGNVPAPSGFTAEQWLAIQALIRTGEWCPTSNRTGWQCSALSFFSSALAAGASVTVTRTSTRAFCMQALLGGVNAGTVSTIQLTSILVDGLEYINDGSLFLKYYTSEAACCLCVSIIPVVPPNSPVSLSFTNGGAAAQNVEVEVEGMSLFCGGP